MKRKYALLLAGLVSGAISGWLFRLDSPWMYSPGAIFGLLVASVLALFRRKGFLRPGGFLAVSAVAFYLALNIAVSAAQGSLEGGMFLAGSIGAAMVWTAFAGFYCRAAFKDIWLSLAGGVAGLSFAAELSRSNGRFLVSFILWQALLAFLLGNEMDKEEELNASGVTSRRYMAAALIAIGLSGAAIAALYFPAFLAERAHQQKINLKEEAQARQDPALCLGIFQPSKPVESWTSWDWGMDQEVEDCIEAIALAKKDPAVCDTGRDAYRIGICKRDVNTALLGTSTSL